MRTYKTTYTKHYYIEGERICSKIGSGFQGAYIPPTSTPIDFIAGSAHICSMQLREMVDRNVQCARYNGEIDINPDLPPAHNDGNEYEKLQYFYHSDHLGSASFVTNRGGGVVQHLQYLPYGELFVSQRNSDEFDSRYKFTAKELDNETSYTYFGARYYDSDLSVWLSVDPMSDKYPSLSPYCYTADNPVVLVDPNGEKVYIVGDAADEATGYLNTDNIKITRNSETGELSYEGKATNKREKLLIKAIDDEKVFVNLTANKSDEIPNTNGERGVGSFLGNKLNSDENGNPISVNTEQFVSMDALNKYFNPKQIKKVMYHEIIESYFGGLISLETGEEALSNVVKDNDRDIYNEAHRKSPYAPMVYYNKNENNVVQINPGYQINKAYEFSQPPNGIPPSLRDQINNNNK
jgi:RHS repeat-associated protein